MFDTFFTPRLKNTQRACLAVAVVVVTVLVAKKEKEWRKKMMKVLNNYAQRL